MGQGGFDGGEGDQFKLLQRTPQKSQQELDVPPSPGAEALTIHVRASAIAHGLSFFGIGARCVV